MILKRYNIPVIIRALKLMGKKSRLFVGCIFGFCAIEMMCTVLYTTGIRGVMNALTNGDIRTFWTSLPLIILQNMAWWIYAPISSYLCDTCSKSTIRNYKTDLCEHIISLPMATLDKKPTGELLSHISNDSDCLRTIYDWTFFQVLRCGIGGLTGVIVMTITDWRFALVVLMLGILSVYASAYFGRNLEENGKKLQDNLAKSSTDAYELVKGAKIIRLLKLYGYESRLFAESTQTEADTKISGGRISAKMNAVILSISSFTYAAILASGAVFVHFGLSDWGTVVALAALKGTADMLFSEFGQHMAGMQRNIAGVKRLFDLMDTSKEKILRDLSFLGKEMPEKLAFENVTFSYGQGVPVIVNFNMKVPHGQLFALVGESGSGKSTLMKLSLGLYEPDGGSIIFCGNSAEAVTFANIRAKTSYVPQDAMLFRGTVFENIACGNPDAGFEEIQKAANLAGAHDFIIRLEKGYDTVILDDGKSLSGGQKQRIAIARALLKNADILLLDEITSALDRETEKGILKTVKDISRYKTVLWITHKPDAADIADIVYRL